MKHIILFSGGKDSQACVIWGKNNLEEDFEIVFNDTNWEAPVTYQFMMEFEAAVAKDIQTKKSTKYKGFIDMSKRKTRFPSTKRRFCTEELKVKPFIDYLLDEVQGDFTVYQGIRWQESQNRSTMNKREDYFRYYFEPHTDNNMKLAAALAKKRKIGRQRKEIPEKLSKEIKELKAKIAQGILDEKYYTYRKKEVFEFCKKWKNDLV